MRLFYIVSDDEKYPWVLIYDNCIKNIIFNSSIPTSDITLRNTPLLVYMRVLAMPHSIQLLVEGRDAIK